MAASLTAGKMPKTQRRSAMPRHLLALSGGGFRGLFTACALAQMEADAGEGKRVADRFDLIAGTSIGGILAIGLAARIPAADLAALLREHGATIFSARWKALGGFASARYDSDSLREAISKILGTAARKPFAELAAPLIVVAVDDQTSEPKLFRTRACDPATPDSLSTLDVALATSAAPTFFAPHSVKQRTYVDGGLIANAPDMILVLEAARRFNAEMSELHLCSIGTASNPRVGTTAGMPGKIGWVMRHQLIELIMDAQAALVADQLAGLGLGTNLRIEARPSRRIEMDDTSDGTATELTNLAEQAVAAARVSHLPAWRRFLAHQLSAP